MRSHPKGRVFPVKQSKAVAQENFCENKGPGFLDELLVQL